MKEIKELLKLLLLMLMPVIGLSLLFSGIISSIDNTPFIQVFLKTIFYVSTISYGFTMTVVGLIAISEFY